MDERFIRNRMILGDEAVAKLADARVAIFGVGGVGGYVAEALARCGVGHICLVDKDTVDITNINRQIIALGKTVGRYKVEVAKERIKEINPEADVDARICFYLPDTADEFDFSEYDYVIDCVDLVTAKIELIVRAKTAGTPIISAMGAGNKLHPELLELSDIYKTSVCPLARVMRSELKKRDIKALDVVYSKETPRKPYIPEGYEELEKIVGSISFVPGAMGLIIAGAVVRGITGVEET